MTTSSLKIKKITRFTATTTSPRTIILQTTPTAELGVGVVTMLENTGLGMNVVTGQIDTGAGTCDLQLSTDVFSPLWTWAGSAHGNPTVTLTYDAGLNVSQVSVNSSSIVIDLESFKQIIATLAPAAE